MNNPKLFDGEWRFMNLIWDHEPINSTELCKLALQELGWKKSTCYTVLKKLADRGFVENSQAVVTSLVARDQVQKYESETMVSKNFGGSLPAFLTTFLKDRTLTEEEAKELQEMIEKAVKR